jgi:N4-gp56 family major capsid protein
MIEMAITKLGNLIDPQVLAEYLDVKLMDAIKFAPLCNVNRDLEGRPGSKLTLPQYAFIGLADKVNEGDDIPMAELSATSIEKEVVKMAKGVTVTDEAILSAYGNPADEVAKQLLMAIAGKVDEDCAAEFRKATKNVSVTGKFNKDAVIDMIAQFGEDMEEDMVLVINAAQLAEIRKDEAFMHVMNGQATISGEIGQLFGARVVVSNRVQANEAFLVKQGAVEIIMKRNVAVEADRNIVNKTNIFTADQHYVVYLRDESKIVKATIA